MSYHVLIRSRFGNLVLGSLGALCLLSSLILTGVMLYSAAKDEMLLEIVLVACGAASCWFLTTSVKNLRSHGH